MHARFEGLFPEAGRSGTTRPVPDASAEPTRLALRVLADGRELVLSRQLSLGRAPENDLVLDDEGVSARHCLVLPQPRGVVLYDCRSTNGTYLNGARVACGELAVGFPIRLGRTHLRVVADRDAPESGAPAPLPGLIGRSQALRAALGQLERVAATGLGVLVLGESGTGKELAARALHALSPRASGPFVAVNCSAIASELAESELFGHERGAFTGAIATRPGVFEEAAGGTLFLDEVGDLPPAVQPKLLRALENGRVRRVGGQGERAVDVRLVAATHRALGPPGFRTDLYHRLARVVIRLPPLRERTEDLAPLVERFLVELASEHGPRTLAPGALEALARYGWPGNVRELRNAVERAALLYGPELSAAELLEGVGEPALGLPPQAAASLAAEPAGELAALIAGRTFRQIEREVIAAALASARGNQRIAAAQLGLPRTTLADRARRHGLLG